MNRTNNKSVNSKLPEIGAIILVLAAVGYYFYSSGGSAQPGSSSFTVSVATTSVGADVLNLLNQISSLRLDTSIFQSPVYQSLTDFTISIPPESIGKSNPFEPIGTSGNSLSASSTPNLASTTVSKHH